MFRLIKMKTRLKIPWAQRINRAKKAKCFTADDVRLSRLWITGPISELEDEIKLKDGQLYRGPEDMRLILDGIHFTKAVENGDVGLAVNSFDGIHERVKILKKQ